MNNLKIIVCCHKEDIYKNSEIYMPLHVGKALSDINLGITGDNTGNHISYKNGSYCELTGMYWAWKNLKGIDYIGLCHYSRYFDFNHLGRKIFPYNIFKTNTINQLNLDISPKAEKWLKNGGCIIPKPSHIHTSLYMQYCEGHYSPDIKLLGDIIREQLPQKYFQSFIDTMIKSNHFSPYNMFIMNWRDFDKYCSWLFSLLNKIEDRIDISHYPIYQQRIFGFMAERLLNLYINAERMKIMHLPIIRFSDEEEIDDMHPLKYLARCLIRDIAVKVTAEIPKIK